MSPDRPKIRMSPRPITNGGVMIGSTVSTRRSRLARNAGARHDQGEREAQGGGRDAGQQGQQKRVPPDAAAAAGQAVEPPDLGREQTLGERTTREGAVAPLDRAEQDPNDRIEREERDEHGHDYDGAGDEDIALEEPARGEPQREQQDEARRDDRGADPQPGLAADGEPGRQCRGRRPRPAPPAAGRGPAAEARRQVRSANAARSASPGTEQLEFPGRGAVGGRVPGQEHETAAAHHGPDHCPAAKAVAHADGVYFGWLLTSRSHRSSRCFRSALAPYFAKS